MTTENASNRHQVPSFFEGQEAETLALFAHDSFNEDLNLFGIHIIKQLDLGHAFSNNKPHRSLILFRNHNRKVTGGDG